MAEIEPLRCEMNTLLLFAKQVRKKKIKQKNGDGVSIVCIMTTVNETGEQGMPSKRIN